MFKYQIEIKEMKTITTSKLKIKNTKFKEKTLKFISR